MKFDKGTLAVLKNFSSINEAIVFTPGNEIRTISPTGTINASATVGFTFDREFSIYNLPKFLASLSLFDDPTITIKDFVASITDASKRKINYVLSEPETSLSAKNLMIIRKRIDFSQYVADSVVDFLLEQKVLNDVQKSLQVLELPHITIRGDGEWITVNAVNIEDPTTHTFTAVVGETKNKFTAVLKSENIKVIPGDYQITLSSSALRLVGKEATYYIGIEKESSF